MSVDQETTSRQVDILVAGSLVVDISCTYTPLGANQQSASGPVVGSSNPANISQCAGGVAHNVALAAHYAGASVLLSSVVSEDTAGRSILKEMEDEGLSTRGILVLEAKQDARTGQYVGNYNVDKALIFGMADVAIMRHPSLEQVDLWVRLIMDAGPRILALDTTFSPRVISTIAHAGKRAGAYLVIEPVSVPRASSLFSVESRVIDPAIVYPKHLFDMITPNEDELLAMSNGALQEGFLHSGPWNEVWESFGANGQNFLDRKVEAASLPEELRQLARSVVVLLPFIPSILVTLGPRGCLYASLLPSGFPHTSNLNKVSVRHEATAGKALGQGTGTVYLRHFPPTRALANKDIVSVNGAGDSLLGVLLAGLTGTSDIETLIPIAQAAAELSLKDASPVSHQIQSLKTMLQT